MRYKKETDGGINPGIGLFITSMFIRSKNSKIVFVVSDSKIGNEQWKKGSNPIAASVILHEKGN